MPALDSICQRSIVDVLGRWESWAALVFGVAGIAMGIGFGFGRFRGLAPTPNGDGSRSTSGTCHSERFLLGCYSPLGSFSSCWQRLGETSLARLLDTVRSRSSSSWASGGRFGRPNS